MGIFDLMVSSMKRLKLLTLSLAVVLQLFLSVFVASATVSAQSQPDESLALRYQKYILATLFLDCVNESLASGPVYLHTGRGKIQNGSIFNVNDPIGFDNGSISRNIFGGDIMKVIGGAADDGVLSDCEEGDNALAKAFFSAVGLVSEQDKIDFVCDAGYKHQNSDCRDGQESSFTVSGATVDSFINAIKNRAGIDLSKEMPVEYEYKYVLDIFTSSKKGCSGKESTSENYDKYKSGGMYFEIGMPQFIINDKTEDPGLGAKIVDTYWNIGENKEVQTSSLNLAYGGRLGKGNWGAAILKSILGAGEKITCSEIAKQLDDFADEYRLLYAKNLICKEEYGIDNDGKLKNCANGLENKSTSGFCGELASKSDAFKNVETGDMVYRGTAGYEQLEKQARANFIFGPSSGSNNNFLMHDFSSGKDYRWQWINTTSIGSFSEDIYKACAVGQQQPVIVATNIPVGIMCYRTYKDETDALAKIAACVRGAIDGTCAWNPTSQLEADRREACLYGTKLQTMDRYKISGSFDALVHYPCTTDDEDCDEGEDASSCTIAGLGWIICPAMNFMGSVLESSFNFLANSFLSTNVNVLRNDQVQAAYEGMRNIANVVFVAAFLVIIYAQITGAGAGGYSIKRLLPRLVIAAILVNISYYICLIAVDISNILGYGLRGMFDAGMFTPVEKGMSEIGDQAGSGAKVAGIIALVLAGAAGAVTVLMSVTFPVVLAAVLALLMIVLILMGRTALIILLTIVSPLAFVAYLLPNTEQWFKRWYKLFASLLMLFPIVAVVFGASSLAGSVLYNVSVTGNDTNNMMQVVALGVTIVPLFLVPSLLKNSLSGAGAIGAKLSGLAGRQGSKATGGMRSKLGERYGRSRMAQAVSNMKYRGNLRRATRRANNPISQAIDNSTLGRAMGFDKGAAAAEAAVDADFQKNVDSAAKMMEHMSSSDVLSIASDARASAERRAAARRHIMSTGSFDDKRKAIATIDDAHVSERERTALKSQYFSSGMNEYFGNSLGESIQKGSVGGEDGLKRAMQANFGNITAQTVAKSGRPAMDYMNNALQSAAADDQLRLKQAILSVNSDAQLNSQISGDARSHFDEMHKLLVGSGGASFSVDHSSSSGTSTGGSTGFNVNL